MCGLSLPLGGSSLAYVVLYFVAIDLSSLIVTAIAYKQIYQVRLKSLYGRPSIQHIYCISKVTKTQANKRKRPSIAGGLASGLELGRTAALNRNDSDPNVTRTKEMVGDRFMKR